MPVLGSRPPGVEQYDYSNPLMWMDYPAGLLRGQIAGKPWGETARGHEISESEPGSWGEIFTEILVDPLWGLGGMAKAAAFPFVKLAKGPASQADDALRLLLRESGGHIDPDVARNLLAAMGPEGQLPSNFADILNVGSRYTDELAGSWPAGIEGRQAGSPMGESLAIREDFTGMDPGAFANKEVERQLIEGERSRIVEGAVASGKSPEEAMMLADEQIENWYAYGNKPLGLLDEGQLEMALRHRRATSQAPVAGAQSMPVHPYHAELWSEFPKGARVEHHSSGQYASHNIPLADASSRRQVTGGLGPLKKKKDLRFGIKEVGPEELEKYYLAGAEASYAGGDYRALTLPGLEGPRQGDMYGFSGIADPSKINPQIQIRAKTATAKVAAAEKKLQQARELGVGVEQARVELASLQQIEKAARGAEELGNLNLHTFANVDNTHLTIFNGQIDSEVGQSVSKSGRIAGKDVLVNPSADELSIYVQNKLPELIESMEGGLRINWAGDASWGTEKAVSKTKKMAYSMPAEHQNSSVFEKLQGRDTTTALLAEEGLRTSTTRGSSLGKRGDLVQFIDGRGSTRETVYKLGPSYRITAEDVANPGFRKRLSDTEGWSEEKLFGGKKPFASAGKVVTYYEIASDQVAVITPGMAKKIAEEQISAIDNAVTMVLSGKESPAFNPGIAAGRFNPLTGRELQMGESVDLRLKQSLLPEETAVKTGLPEDAEWIDKEIAKVLNKDDPFVADLSSDIYRSVPGEQPYGIGMKKWDKGEALATPRKLSEQVKDIENAVEDMAEKGSKATKKNKALWAYPEGRIKEGWKGGKYEKTGKLFIGEGEATAPNFMRWKFDELRREASHLGGTQLEELNDLLRHDDKLKLKTKNIRPKSGSNMAAFLEERTRFLEESIPRFLEQRSGAAKRVGEFADQPEGLGRRLTSALESIKSKTVGGKVMDPADETKILSSIKPGELFHPERGLSLKERKAYSLYMGLPEDAVDSAILGAAPEIKRHAAKIEELRDLEQMLPDVPGNIVGVTSIRVPQAELMVPAVRQLFNGASQGLAETIKWMEPEQLGTLLEIAREKAFTKTLSIEAIEKRIIELSQNPKLKKSLGPENILARTAYSVVKAKKGKTLYAHVLPGGTGEVIDHLPSLPLGVSSEQVIANSILEQVSKQKVSTLVLPTAEASATTTQRKVAEEIRRLTGVTPEALPGTSARGYGQIEMPTPIAPRDVAEQMAQPKAVKAERGTLPSIHAEGPEELLKSSRRVSPDPKPSVPHDPDYWKRAPVAEGEATVVHFTQNKNPVLSNFHEIKDSSGKPQLLEFRDKKFKTAEGAYQAFKTGNYVEGFEHLLGSAAKKKGGGYQVDRATSDALMEEVIEARFHQDGVFREALSNTGNITHPVGRDHWTTKFPEILENVRDKYASRQEAQTLLDAEADKLFQKITGADLVDQDKTKVMSALDRLVGKAKDRGLTSLNIDNLRGQLAEDGMSGDRLQKLLKEIRETGGELPGFVGPKGGDLKKSFTKEINRLYNDEFFQKTKFDKKRFREFSDTWDKKIGTWLADVEHALEGKSQALPQQGIIEARVRGYVKELEDGLRKQMQRWPKTPAFRSVNESFELKISQFRDKLRDIYLPKEVPEKGTAIDISELLTDPKSKGLPPGDVTQATLLPSGQVRLHKAPSEEVTFLRGPIGRGPVEELKLKGRASVSGSGPMLEEVYGPYGAAGKPSAEQLAARQLAQETEEASRKLSATARAKEEAKAARKAEAQISSRVPPGGLVSTMASSEIEAYWRFNFSPEAMKKISKMGFGVAGLLLASGFLSQDFTDLKRVAA